MSKETDAARQRSRYWRKQRGLVVVSVELPLEYEEKAVRIADKIRARHLARRLNGTKVPHKN